MLNIIVDVVSTAVCYSVLIAFIFDPVFSTVFPICLSVAGSELNDAQQASLE